MKAVILQPPYSRDISDADRCFEEKIRMLDRCDESADLIVLPEYSDVPAAADTLKEVLALHNRYFERLMEKCAETAKRCKSILFVNALSKAGENYRNTTYAFDRGGTLVGQYFKRHLPPSEAETLALDSSYADKYEEPYVLTIEGLRYAFLTCYDFYYYEAFSAIARKNVDLIIGCSLQRSDTHEATEIMCRFLAYQTNAYVIRSSVSFGEDSPVCGAGMAVAPDGKVLLQMKSRIGMESVTIDPEKKYYKPAGFGNPEKAHHEYVEYGRRPWLYRPAGPSVSLPEKTLPYPRLCAHRGFSAVAPENTLPSFGAAVAVGADEIEMDLWPTLDGEIVSCHDRSLDRTSDGTGRIDDKTMEELSRCDFGIRFGEKFQGLKVLTFEEILKRFSCQTIMNIHVKPLTLDEPYPEDAMKKIVALIRKYDAEKHVYFMLSADPMIRQFKSYAPDIPITVGHLAARPWEIVDRAIEFGCGKVQLFKPYFNQEMIDKAHAHGIRCNVFYADEPEEARRYLDMGIDTILTNDYLKIARAIGKYNGDT